MVKLVFKKKKDPQLLSSFASAVDVLTRYGEAGLEVEIRNREHGVPYKLTEEGFVAGAFAGGEVPEPKIGEIDVMVRGALDNGRLAVLALSPDLPTKLGDILLPKTACIFGTASAPGRLRVYRIEHEGPQGMIIVPTFVNKKAQQKCQWTVDLANAANVCKVHEQGILFPPGCNEAGEQLVFASGCAAAPPVVLRHDLIRTLRMLDIAVRHKQSWPTDPPARIAFAKNCVRLFAGIGVAPDAAVEIARLCAVWAGYPDDPGDAELDKFGDLAPLAESDLKSLCTDLWGAGGMALGEKYFDWFKVDETDVVNDIGAQLGNGFAMASGIQPEKFDWLWPGYLPKGAIITIDGLPGEGKSMLACDVTGRVSSGIAFPGGGEVKPQKVILINGEDDVPKVTVPRILAAGGNLDNVIIWPDPAADYEPLLLPDKISVLAMMADRHDVGLVIIDPLHSHISSKHKVESDQLMKAALQPLTKLAQAKGMCVLAVRHTTKVKTGNAVTAGLGSIGTIASARVGYIVGPDPDGSGTKVFACSKVNGWTMPESLSFQIKKVAVKSPTGETLPVGRLEWLGTTTIKANDLCKPDKAGKASKLQEAVEFLKVLLSEGPMKQQQVEDLAVDVGIAVSTLNKAKAAIGVKSNKFPSHWDWELPGQEV